MESWQTPLFATEALFQTRILEELFMKFRGHYIGPSYIKFLYSLQNRYQHSKKDLLMTYTPFSYLQGNIISEAV